MISDIAVLAKIESIDSLKNMEEIIRASDSTGDTGTSRSFIFLL